MKKFTKIALVALVVCLVGCGEIPYENITGDWTTKSMDGKSVAEYAAALGTTAEMAAMNMEIKDDNTLVATNAASSQTYQYERKSDGIEVKQQGKDEILFSMTYDDSAKTLTYKMDLGNSQIMTIVMEHGKVDFSGAGASEQ